MTFEEFWTARDYEVYPLSRKFLVQLAWYGSRGYKYVEDIPCDYCEKEGAFKIQALTYACEDCIEKALE